MVEKKHVILGVNVSEAERERVHELARKRGFDITSDYLRALIKKDATEHGIELEFEVNRGGNRHVKS